MCRLPVAAVTLTGFCLVLGPDAAIRAEGAADIVALGEPAMAVTADISFISFVRLDEFAFRAHDRTSHRRQRLAAWTVVTERDAAGAGRGSVGVWRPTTQPRGNGSTGADCRVLEAERVGCSLFSLRGKGKARTCSTGAATDFIRGRLPSLADTQPCEKKTTSHLRM